MLRLDHVVSSPRSREPRPRDPRPTWHLRNEGHAVNPKRVRRLMRITGLMPIYRKPNTSRPAKGRRPFPYLLRGLTIDRPNQVWCADITYLPMRRGFLYLVAIMDWHSRRALSWRLSNTLGAEFCAEALDEAIARFGAPEIMNTDQGSQFTAFTWMDRLRRASVRISMDGKGRFLDNIFIERLAQPQIRMRLPARLGDRIAGARGAADLVRLLQPPAASRCPRRTTTGRGLPRRHDDHATRPGDPESSLENGRSCPRIGEHLTMASLPISCRRDDKAIAATAAQNGWAPRASRHTSVRLGSRVEEYGVQLDGH
ncbi:DDE-type integrase/transposase/recombinase [Histidinibacterium aquaticum]|uniref:DDE-type integrase/transposase/recombinase n=1 Tax=Histidinibacterium aquaticum TaxID=2613962 RepID=A0A5J5GKI4_9RHOB|nr:DDE-type integrase/transposase/recombinase [Histidinibacterium aquaticum]